MYYYYYYYYYYYNNIIKITIIIIGKRNTREINDDYNPQNDNLNLLERAQQSYGR